MTRHSPAPTGHGTHRWWLLLLLLLALAPVVAVQAAPLQSLAVATMETLDGPFVPERLTVTLPLDRKLAVDAGSARARRFELGFRMDEAPAAPLVIAFYSSSPPRVSVNGAVLLASPIDPAPNPDPREVPVRFDVPPSLLHSGLNDLQIVVAASAGRIQLSAVELGPVPEMKAWVRQRQWLGSTGFKVANLAIGGIAHFFLVLWTWRRQNSIYGLFSLSGFLWIASVAPRFAVPLADSVPDVARAMAILSTGFSASLIAVGVRLMNPGAQRHIRWLWAGAAAAGLGMLAIPSASAGWFPRIESLSLLLAPGAVLLLALAGMRRPAREGALVLASSAVAVLAGFASDGALTSGFGSWPAPHLASFGVLYYVIGVGGWLVNCFIRDREALDRRKAELEGEARRREQALASRYAAAAELDRRYAAAAERERFLAQVHEGLGAHLQQSRDRARSGPLPAADAESLLNGAVNELRIAIESCRPGAESLLMMLGNLRYRLESRLRRAGIDLEWEVRGEIADEAHSPAVIADLSRITYEMFTNAIRHSGASRLKLAVHFLPGSGISIEIIDNGCGFDVSAGARGRGLRKVQQLADRIQAKWSLSSTAGGTRLALTL